MPIVQGKPTDSKEEYWYAVALSRLEYRYTFKYQIGITGVGGAVEVDFLVYDPFPTPDEIMGDWWHPDLGENEAIRTAKITQYFGREPNQIEADRITGVAAAISIIRELHG